MFISLFNFSKEKHDTFQTESYLVVRRALAEMKKERKRRIPLEE